MSRSNEPPWLGMEVELDDAGDVALQVEYTFRTQKLSNGRPDPHLWTPKAETLGHMYPTKEAALARKAWARTMCGEDWWDEEIEPYIKLVEVSFRPLDNASKDA